MILTTSLSDTHRPVQSLMSGQTRAVPPGVIRFRESVPVFPDGMTLGYQ